MSPVQVLIDFEDPGFFIALEDPDGFEPYLEKAMVGIMTAFKTVAEVYAPESDANKPGRMDKEGKPMGYYERGRGWWYPLVTHNKLGLGQEIPTIGLHSKAPKTMGAKALMARGVEGVAGYKLIATSEQMHDQWVWEVIPDPSGVIGNLTNLASYSGGVQGLEQAPLHKSRGWQTVIQSWDTPEVQAAVEDESMRAIIAYYHLGV